MSLRNVFGKRFSRRPMARRDKRRSPRQARPLVERLEDRVVPVVQILNGGGNGYIGNGGGGPPDVTGMAGPSSYIEVTNSTVTIFSPDTTRNIQAQDGILDFFYNPAIGNQTPITNSVANIAASPNGAKEAGNTVTITTAAPHGFTVNKLVKISGVGVAGYNGVFKITGVTATTFTYQDTTAGLANSGGGTAVEILSCGVCDSTGLFDNLMGANGRFIVADIDVDNTANTSQFLYAVSKTSNPTALDAANWNFYHVTTTEGSTNTDYPGNPGFNADAFVVTFNMAKGGFLTGDTQILSISATDLANGVPAPATFHNDISGSRDYRPATMHDSVAGDPMWLIRDPQNGTQINVTRMSKVLSNAAVIAPQPPLNLPPGTTFTPGSVNPIQPNGTALNDVPVRILKAAEYNNIVVATEKVEISGTQTDAEWYAIDVSGATPAFQMVGGAQNVGQIGFGANSYVFDPAIDINSLGEIGLGFMESDTVGGAVNAASGGFVSTFVTARLPSDAAGTMEPIVLVPAGKGTKNLPAQRVGDFSGMSVDPVLQTFWHVNEFANGTNAATDVAEFTLIPPSVIFQNGTVLLCGDMDNVNENDIFKLQLDSTGALLEVFINNPGPIPTAIFPLAIVQKVAIYGAGGNNTLMVDSSNGLISVPQGVDWNAADPCPNMGGGGGEGAAPQAGGEDGFNQTIFQQSGANQPTLTSDVYTVGPTTAGNGISVVKDNKGKVQTVFFYEVSPTFDSLPAPILTVNGTNADNAINYTTGKNSFANFFATPPVTDTKWGEVSIDNQEPIEFTNKDHLVINALAGNDTINLNNPNKPAGSNTTTTPGLLDIAVDGGDATTSDILIVNGTTAVDTFTFTPTGADKGSVAITSLPTVNFTTTETVVINGQGGADKLTYQSPAGGSLLNFIPGPTVNSGSVTGRRFSSQGGTMLVPMNYVNFDHSRAYAQLTFANTGGHVDDLAFYGTPGSDVFTVLPNAGDGSVMVERAGIPDALTHTVDTVGILNLTLHGLDGDDTFNLTGPLPYNATVVDGGDPSASDVLNLTTRATAVNIGVNLATASITGFETVSGNSIFYLGVELVNLNVTNAADTLTASGTGVPLYYTPTGANSGAFQNLGDNTTFHFNGLVGNFTVTQASEVILNGTPSNDTIFIDATTRSAAVSSLKPVILAADVPVLTALGFAGQDTFDVTPDAGPGGSTANLVINVNGGDPSNNALVVHAPGAGQFTVVNKSLTPNAGTVRVFRAAAAFPDIHYANVQVVSPVVASPGNLLVMGPDTNEPNESRPGAAFVGPGSALQILHATIFPNDSEFPGVVADQDYYRFVAQFTGTLDFQVYFRMFSTALLPAGGDIDIEVLTAGGAVVAGFGNNDSTDNERVRIPVVAGQTYYLHVFGKTAAVVNGYDVAIINTPPPVPYNLELSRNNPPGDLPPGAPLSDTGRSQFDNVTRNTTPTIFVRLNDAIFLNDLPGNGTPDTPPDEVIPIPFIANGGAPGYRVLLFDGTAPDAPLVGGTNPIMVSPGIYRFDVLTPLVDGLHHLTARVQMIDPAFQTGLGDHSVITLDIIVDTVAPPVSFGNGNGDTGLAGDSGVQSFPATFIDRVTNNTRPTFYGRAEANAIIRLTTVGAAGATIFLGETVAVPLDGTNAFPGGQWVLTSLVDLNDPTFFPHDGTRVIQVTAEDLAGNVSFAQTLTIFIDTQGPQVTNVQITGFPTFNLFGLKPANFAQGPTPLVNSLTLFFQDLPARDTSFPNLVALLQAVAQNPGNYVLQGDNTGLIGFKQVLVTVNPPINGQPATATVQLVFFAPLPDDRYTLTISDNLTDLAGNPLDGESNAAQPVGVPTFPSGNGVPGGPFIARFTVNSRPEIGTACCGSQYVDINGNGVFDPVNKNNDQTNADLVFHFGLTTDSIFAGDFSPTAVSNGFQKLGAYGQVNGAFRWLLDFNGDGVPDYSTVSGLQINGLPVAGPFATVALSQIVGGNLRQADQIGLFDGHGNWYLDTNLNNNIDAGDTVVSDGLSGYPIVGDFDGNGSVDLATYRPDQDTFYFDLNPLGGPRAFPTIHFGFVGVQERPVAGDMNKDGVTDIGLFVPNRQGATPIDTAEWYFLVSNNTAATPAIPGTVNLLDHQFSPTPLGTDLFYKFGGNNALPFVGLFDPPIGPVAPATPQFTLSSGILAAGADAGGAPLVQVLDSASGAVKFSFYAYDPSFTGGVRVAVGDVTGDGIPDVVTAPGYGGGPEVKVFSGADGSLLTDFFAYAPGFTGGVSVAVGDVNGDGHADIVTGAGPGGGPLVNVFSGADGSLMRSFFPFNPAFAGGVNVAAGDVTGDGKADIIAAAGPGGGPEVKVVNGVNSAVVADFMAYDVRFNGGVNVAVGDVTGDGWSDIVTAPGAGGGPYVMIFAAGGAPLGGFAAYAPFFTGGVRVGLADVNHDGRLDVLTGPGPGGGPDVRAFDGPSHQPLLDAQAFPGFFGGLFVAGSPGTVHAIDPHPPVTTPQFTLLDRGVIVTGADAGGPPLVRGFDGRTGMELFHFYAFDPAFTGGVRVATGDYNSDGVTDIIVAAGPGGGPEVKVFSGAGGGLLLDFFAFSPAFTGGVSLAAADVNRDGRADIVVGAGPGGAPEVKVVSGGSAMLMRDFYAYAVNFGGGVNVAAGDVNGDGFADVITGAGPGGGPEVRVFSGQNGALLDDFFGYDPRFTGGVSVAAGDVNGDGLAEIVTGPGAGGGPDVRVFRTDGTLLKEFLAYDPRFAGGVRVAVADVNDDGRGDVLTAAGPGGGPHIEAFDGTSLALLDSLYAYDPAFTGGVFVGGVS